MILNIKNKHRSLLRTYQIIFKMPIIMAIIDTKNDYYMCEGYDSGSFNITVIMQVMCI